MTKTRLLFVSLFAAMAVIVTFGVMAQQAAPAKPAAHVLPKVAKVTVNDPVTLTDNGDSWTLDNGIVKATILKSNGNMTTVYYKGIDIPNSRSEYWEQTPAGTVTAKVTIDPSTNGGERAGSIGEGRKSRYSGRTRRRRRACSSTGSSSWCGWARRSRRWPRRGRAWWCARRRYGCRRTWWRGACRRTWRGWCWRSRRSRCTWRIWPRRCACGRSFGRWPGRHGH